MARRSSSLLQLVATAIALLAVVALIWYLRRQSPPPIPETPPTTAPAAAGDPAAGAAGPRSTAARPLRLPQTQVPGVERIDAEQRAQLLKAIQQKLTEKKRAEEEAAVPATAGQAQSAPGSDSQFGSLDREYIQARIREIVPLIRECYEMTPEDQPLPDVTLKVKFKIEGAPELGGIVTSSDILNQEAEQQHPELAECVRETMYALRMKAPRGGGTVIVTYPFTFRAAPGSPPTPSSPGSAAP
ncbi:MAG: AgmX/PglI C-terminal domain-containing protein [Deltaproteobacteria bacterium]|nr:AgmX/PglI C-terminal domain-containing protein [Deltaproteobacteria bacterium]